MSEPDTIDEANEMRSQIAERFRGFLPVVVDVETGGFNAHTDALLEIAAVLLELRDGELAPAQSHRYHVKPVQGLNIEPASLQITGIDPWHPLRPAIDEGDALRELFRHIRKEVRGTGCKRAVLVGHNSSFDLGFINEAILRTSIKRSPFHPFSSFDTATLCGVAYSLTVCNSDIVRCCIRSDCIVTSSASCGLAVGRGIGALGCLRCGNNRGSILRYRQPFSAGL